MSWSISVTMNADGEIAVETTDCMGGCPFTIAWAKPGYLEGVEVKNLRDALDKALEWSPHAPSLDRYRVLVALRQLAMCLPTPDMFNEEGRPKRKPGIREAFASPRPFGVRDEDPYAELGLKKP